MHIPIEAQQRKNKTFIGALSERTNKEIARNLDHFVFTPETPDSLDEEVEDNVFNEDECFFHFFAFSRFWRDLILHAISNFPEEHSLKTKSSGLKLKFFCQKE